MDIKWIAEIGANFNGNIDRTKKLIEVVKEIGCQGVKFQFFKAEKLFAPCCKKEIKIAKAKELPYNFIPQIAEYCENIGIKFGCSVFHQEAVEYLIAYVDFFKISSYDLLRLDLIKTCLDTKLPLVISTGMAAQKDIYRAASLCTTRKRNDETITFLHCVSKYPTNVEEVNLIGIEHLRVFWPWVGWSDHSKNPAVLYQAAGLSCTSMIEFHLDLDGQGLEYGCGHCWLPREVAPVIKICNGMRKAYGNIDGILQVSEEGRGQRADSSDGLRPMKEARKNNENI